MGHEYRDEDDDKMDWITGAVFAGLISILCLAAALVGVGAYEVFEGEQIVWKTDVRT